MTEHDGSELQLDSDLVHAVDQYLARIRTRMLARLRLGEPIYHGSWKTKPKEALETDLDEEYDDMHCYRAMLEWRDTHDAELPDI